MAFIIPIIFFVALAVQLVFVLFIFTKLVRHEDKETSQHLPPISIILAASNELDNLRQLLPILDSQDYPNFEILVADDRSSDGTYDYLLTNQDNIKHLSFLRILDLPQHFTAKKYAVTMAVKKSKNEILLFTDADCRPESDQWLKTMVSQMDEEKDIVLGFSKYNFFPGALNALIRYETFQTALQYFSFALAKVPYMGVGRNLMYKKSLFWKNNGFTKHFGLLSGDDDLFINAAANKHNVAISIDEDSATNSIPKESWGDWFIQKRRHLSVGKKYKFRDKFNLGLLWMSELISWFFFIPVFFMLPDWYQAPEWSRIPNEFLKQYNLAHWYPFNDWMRLVLGVFVLWILVKWFVLAKANQKLSNTIKSWKIPYFDFLYAVYLLFFGIVTLFSNPKKIRWK
ncbi:glycosyltransferase [Lacihabitans sp. LS3-19]|uniref:glycosyltransferase n=1 Tax=Lacihabitans sp. LS3-19 TaxID=2487335 RepID=UPI0020CCCCA9|nr:glycosyltransferase [Lacihabitans sp. LS3-19]MCP9767212.1 glycosyltransferase [Lacihabitans sp. LS3-19]